MAEENSRKFSLSADPTERRAFLASANFMKAPKLEVVKSLFPSVEDSVQSMNVMVSEAITGGTVNVVEEKNSYLEPWALEKSPENVDGTIRQRGTSLKASETKRQLDTDQSAKKNRGSYRCRRCGLPKRGHTCYYNPGTSDDMQQQESNGSKRKISTEPTGGRTQSQEVHRPAKMQHTIQDTV